MFTKKDLRSGMVVEVRCRKRYLVVEDSSGRLQLIRDDGHLCINKFNENLENETNDKFDIVKVFEPLNYLSINYLFECHTCRDCWYLNEDKQELKPQPEEMTLEEICKALGKNIKIVKYC